MGKRGEFNHGWIGRGERGWISKDHYFRDIDWVGCEPPFFKSTTAEQAKEFPLTLSLSLEGEGITLATCLDSACLYSGKGGGVEMRPATS